MKEKFKILLLIICLGLAGVFFVNTIIDDFEEETVGKQGQNLLESIKVAYPPDDSLMVIYLGCSKKPQIRVDE